MTTTTKTPISQARREALEQVTEHEATVARWEAEKLAAEQELASLQDRAGEEALADPSAAGRLPKMMQELRDRVDIAERALAVAGPRLGEARRAVLLAEAEEWDAEVAKRRKALERHVAKIDELLAALLEHDEVEYGRVVEDATPIAPGETRIVRAPVQQQLNWKVLQAELTVHVLRELAAGRDPSAELQAKGDIFNRSRIFGLPASAYYTPYAAEFAALGDLQTVG